MHVISQQRIWEAKRKFPSAESALDGWYRIIKRNTICNFADLKRYFNSVDKVDNLYVFNINGNNLRLIASIHFNRQKIYIRNIITHKEYDKDCWKIGGK